VIAAHAWAMEGPWGPSDLRPSLAVPQLCMHRALVQVDSRKQDAVHRHKEAC